MKLRFLFIVFTLLVFISCKENIVNVTDTLVHIEETEVELDYLPGAKKCIVFSTNAQYFRLHTSTDGVNVNTNFIVDVNDGKINKDVFTSVNGFIYNLSLKDGKYELTVMAQNGNETTNEIEEYYVLKTASETIPLRISQLAKGDAKQEKQIMFPEGGVYECSYESSGNDGLKAEKVIGDEWLRYTFDDSTGKLRLECNYWKSEDGDTDRNGAIRIYNTKEGTIDLIVTQSAPYVKFDKKIILIEGTEDIHSKINVETNMPRGSINVSDKLESEDIENRVSCTPLEYLDEGSRNASFEVNVNMDGITSETPISCKYCIVGINDAAGLNVIEKENIVISRSQVLIDECFINPDNKPFSGYWQQTADAGNFDKLNIGFSGGPLSYFDENGEYILSGIGQSLKKDTYIDGIYVKDQHISSPFPSVSVGGTVYMAFLFKLDEIPYKYQDHNRPDAEYYPILGLCNGGSSRHSLVYVGKPQNEKKYRFGISFANIKPANVVWSDETFDESEIDKIHLLVLKMEFPTEDKKDVRASLFINPSLGKPEPEPTIKMDGRSNPSGDTPNGTTVNSIFTLEYTDSQKINVRCQFGNIRVGKNWDEVVKMKPTEDAE